MKHLWPAIVWALCILVMCGMPGSDIPRISFLEILAFDKWVHAGIFLILVVLLIRGFRLQFNGWWSANAVLVSLVFCVVYGGVLELLQGAVFEERSADVLDFIANSFGAIIGVLLYRSFAKRIRFMRLP
ncbi:MAG TPA: VanZ family protein [Bacteroidia bacterium]|nr:VanZ family protein [Bacteroidia bacterium]